MTTPEGIERKELPKEFQKSVVNVLNMAIADPEASQSIKMTGKPLVIVTAMISPHGGYAWSVSDVTGTIYRGALTKGSQRGLFYLPIDVVAKVNL